MHAWQRRAIPAWCLVTEAGRLMSPKHNWLQIPSDCDRCLDIRWDGLDCRADYFTWNYGEVYRYSGPSLPVAGEQWQQERYTPSPELEALVVNLAGAGAAFSDLLRKSNRPRAEVCAILEEHGYQGWSLFIHGI